MAQPLVVKFESWGAFIDAMDKPSPHFPEAKCTSRRVGGEWHGTPSWGAAFDLSETGWIEGAAKVEALSSGMVDKVSSLIAQHHIVYDVEGRDYDVARILQGEPECWQDVQVEYSEGAGGVTRIVLDSFVSSGVSSEAIIGRGAATAALVTLLERSGRAVEVVLGAAMTGGSESDAEAYIMLKYAGQPIDMPRLAYALAHPSSFRRHIFSLFERLPDKDVAVKVGACNFYGHPSQLRVDRGDIYIPSAAYGDSQWTDAAKATHWVMENLRLQGVVLIDE